MAQETSIKTSDSIDAEQYARIEAWVTRQMNQLRSGLRDDVADARKNLTKELRAMGASEAYRTALSKAVLDTGAPLLKSQKLLTQINIITVLGQVNTLDAVQALIPVISDPASGLRYKACQSIALLIEPTPAERRNIGPEREQKLLKAVSAQIAKETDRNVYCQLVDLLNTLGSPAAQDILLRTLGERLGDHTKNPNLDYAAELNGINNLYRKFIQTDEKGPMLMSLLAVAYRHERLAVAQAAAKPKDTHMTNPDRKALILACDKLIRAQYTRLGASAQMPPSISAMVTFNKWSEAQDAIAKWEPLLMAAPLSIPAVKLK